MLLGDSAHPMLQYLAQGACQAIEDAAALSAAVARAAPGRPRAGDWPTILDAFVDDRRAHTGRVQRTARLWGDSWHVDGVARVLRNELMQRRDHKDYRYTDWLYGPAR